MKNYVQNGDVLSLLAPYAVAAGDGLKVGSIVGIATSAADSGADVEVLTRGVVDVTKTSAQAWTVGALLGRFREAVHDDQHVKHARGRRGRGGGEPVRDGAGPSQRRFLAYDVPHSAPMRRRPRPGLPPPNPSYGARSKNEHRARPLRAADTPLARRESLT